MTTATEPTPAENDSGRHCTAAVAGASTRPGTARTTTAPSVACRVPEDAHSVSDEPPGKLVDRLALRADSPAECIAAAPALLGFMPRRSIVVYLLNEAPRRPGEVVLGAVARHDLDVSDRAEWPRLFEHLAAFCVRQHAVAVLALIIDDRAGVPTAGRAGTRSRRHRELVAALGSALAAEEITLDEVWGMCEIGAGAAWWDVREPASTGVQNDPAASPLALAEALDGHPIRSSRADLAALVAIDAAQCQEVSGELEMAAAVAGHRFRAAVFLDEVHRYQLVSLCQVLDRVDGIADGGDLAARDLADTAVALRDPTVRDALFALAGGDRADAAERLWADLCRTLIGPDRAEAATLLGYSAYTRGDGSLAGIALHAALESNPDHTIARLLDTALGVGMHPQEIRKLACSGRAKAAGLGVELDLHPEWPLTQGLRPRDPR